MVRFSRATTPSKTRHSITDDTGIEEQGIDDGALMVQSGKQQIVKKIQGKALEKRGKACMGVTAIAAITVLERQRVVLEPWAA
mmetsp:Transcript_6904/g.42138  ORF Transcript_6904/g.42138 Transcript_6904/m.42138 type:complete len:83 (+) Transcript_6904:1465-1713(+)